MSEPVEATLLASDGVSDSLPSAVRVGAVTYTVITDRDAIREASDSSDAAARGGEWKAFSDHDRLLIGLPPEDADDANRLSLLHELLHCCLRHSGAWPDMYARVLDQARDRDAGIGVEEFTVSGLAAPLLSVLKDNPAVVAWLLAQPKARLVHVEGSSTAPGGDEGV